MSAVTCLTWVPRGIAKAIPDKVEFNAKDFKEFVDMSMKANKFSSNESEEEATESKDLEDEDDVMAKYNMDDYDNDDNQHHDIDLENAFNEDDENNTDDPHLIVEDDEFDNYDKSCFEIQSNDNLLVVGQAEEEGGQVAIYVYNEEDDDLYVHHDIILPHLPLSVEWIGCNPADGSPGNFIAVGSTNSEISLWNLDVVNTLYPDFVLGKDEKKSKKHPEKGSQSYLGHTDSVLSVSWNKILKNILASGSADCTICVWNLFSQSILHKIDYHCATVQSVQWHTSEPQFLLSGSVDGTVCLFDCKVTKKPCMMWKINGEIEKVLWNHFNPYFFICSTDLGFVYVLDCRKKGIIHSFKAHEGAAMSLTMLCKTSNTLITAGADECVKVWDMNESPALISDQKLELGSIFAIQVCPDAPYIIAVGGDNKANNLTVRNIQESIDDEDE